MTDATTSPLPARSRSVKVGVWALTLVLFLVVYLTVGVVLALLAPGGNEVVASIAYGMFFIGLLVVPVCGIVAFVLGVIALIVERRLGKVLGGIAVLVVVGCIIAVGVFLGGSSDLV
ncbi:MAG: hypothetical protein Q8M65_07265, partial [Rhodoglobus sp.]|nr:hypothetical protein [Rhodoglobus sp.]